jgi:hypothetical protein
MEVREWSYLSWHTTSGEGMRDGRRMGEREKFQSGALIETDALRTPGLPAFAPTSAPGSPARCAETR